MGNLMAYSSIQDKIGICCDCTDGIKKPLIAGRCKYYHYKIHRDKVALEKIKAKNKFRSLKSIPKNKEILVEKGLVKDENKMMLDLWYLARKYEMTGYCSEEGCRSSTNKDNDKYYRWSCCHIVPKALVPSVATHLANCIELCQIHHQEYDAGFERAKRMKCFEIAKRAFGTFKHLIPPQELRKVNPYLLNDEIPDTPVEQAISTKPQE